jgi:ABC-type amino acid transport substrate-binding protein
MGERRRVVVTPTRKLNQKQAAALSFVIAFVIVSVLYTIQEIQRRKEDLAYPHGEIRIAVDAGYYPFTVYTDDGLEGIDIDIGMALGEELGLQVRFVPMSVDGLYDSLANDQVDIIISALVVTYVRTEDVRYTRPYFDSGLVLVSPKDALIAEMESLPGHSLAYEFGSNADTEARTWQQAIEAYETQPYELPPYALDAVRLGVADAALVDAVDAHLYLRDHPQWQAEINYVTHVQYVIAVRFDRNNTFNATEKALSKLMRQGIIEQILKRWL